MKLYDLEGIIKGDTTVVLGRNQMDDPLLEDGACFDDIIRDQNYINSTVTHIGPHCNHDLLIHIK